MGFDLMKSYVESIMETSGPDPFPSTGSALFAASRIYGALMQWRKRWYEKGRFVCRRLPCKVISVGNLTMGGSGKTPMAMRIAEIVRKSGMRVAIVSRGYGGTAQARGGMVSDGDRLWLTADVAGDEPLMMASRLPDVPVLVGKNRYEAGLRACGEMAAEVIVLDDAFQHLALHRDLDIVLMDGRKPIGNGHLFPRGRLREPVAGVARADAVVLTRFDGSSNLPQQLASALESVKTVFHSGHRPVCFRVRPEANRKLRLAECHSGELKDLKISAFSGIADNDDFYRMLLTLGSRVVDFHGFMDHHRYTDEELARLVDNAGLPVVTTEKDFARIAHRLNPHVQMFVVGVDTDFGEQAEAFEDFIKAKL